MRIRDKFGFAADRIWANALDSEECCRFVRYKDRTAIDFSDRWEEPLSVECSDFDLPFSLRVLKAAEAARLVEYTIKEAST